MNGLIHGHIKSLEKKENPVFNFFYSRSGWFGFALFVAILSVGIYSTLHYTSRLDSATRAQIEELLSDNQEIEEVVIEVIRVFTIREFVLGERVPSLGVVVSGLLISIVTAALLTGLSAHTIDKLARRSQILLTRKSRLIADENRIGYTRKLMGFVAVQFLNVLIGLLVIALSIVLPTDWLL